MELTLLQIQMAGALALWVLLGFAGNFLQSWSMNYKFFGIHRITADDLYMWVWVGGPLSLIASLFVSGGMLREARKRGKPQFPLWLAGLETSRIVWEWDKKPTKENRGLAPDYPKRPVGLTPTAHGEVVDPADKVNWPGN